MQSVTVKNFYQNLPRLETTRLILRKTTSSDIPDIFVYSSDVEVTRYLRWGPHQTLTETENYIQGVLDEYHEGRDGPWMMELKQSHTVIGHIHLMDISLQHSKTQVGFVLARAYWNKGIMTEALNAVLECSFAGIGLHRVEGLCISVNRAAARVLEKVGMTKEGELRDYLNQKGAFWNFSIYAILREEFSRR
ncbi:MAG: GNAT family N-acetyltransferase [Chloroflexi bacterium]|nr:GNAT family N-acetyltransferase [Chloroflexota bacterium]